MRQFAYYIPSLDAIVIKVFTESGTVYFEWDHKEYLYAQYLANIGELHAWIRLGEV